MKSVVVMYPTRNRLAKLNRSLTSLLSPVPETPIEIVVVCDGDPLTARALIDDPRVDLVVYLRDREGSVYARNFISQTVEDGLICSVDDITFEPGAVDAAVHEMRRAFPDGDGIVGFKRADRDHSKMKVSSGKYGGVALIGQKFLCRYPNRKLCYPGYFLFAAQEMTNLGVKLDKIVVAEDARIYHHSPRKGGGMDLTHIEGRKFRRSDRDIRKRRGELGKLWGQYPEDNKYFKSERFEL